MPALRGGTARRHGDQGDRTTLVAIRYPRASWGRRGRTPGFLWNRSVRPSICEYAGFFTFTQLVDPPSDW